jgi:hypothetical protein
LKSVQIRTNLIWLEMIWFGDEMSWVNMNSARGSLIYLFFFSDSTPTPTRTGPSQSHNLSHATHLLYSLLSALSQRLHYHHLSRTRHHSFFWVVANKTSKLASDLWSLTSISPYRLRFSNFFWFLLISPDLSIFEPPLRTWYELIIV